MSPNFSAFLILFHRTSIALHSAPSIQQLKSCGSCRVGDLRLRLPVANLPYNGTHNATSFGPSCPQQAFVFSESVEETIAPLAQDLAGLSSTDLVENEDCAFYDLAGRTAID